MTKLSARRNQDATSRLVVESGHQVDKHHRSTVNTPRTQQRVRSTQYLVGSVESPGGEASVEGSVGDVRARRARVRPRRRVVPGLRGRARDTVPGPDRCDRWLWPRLPAGPERGRARARAGRTGHCRSRGMPPVVASPSSACAGEGDLVCRPSLPSLLFDRLGNNAGPVATTSIWSLCPVPCRHAAAAGSWSRWSNAPFLANIPVLGCERGLSQRGGIAESEFMP